MVIAERPQPELAWNDLEVKNSAAPRPPSSHKTFGGPARHRGSTRALVALLAFVLGFATVPHRVMEREASTWFDGNPTKADALSANLARHTASATELLTPSGVTSSFRFDGERVFATYVMSAMGFGQLALDRADVRELSLARMETCLEAMLDPRVREFGDRKWGEDALASVASAPGSPSDRGHVGFLGYAGLALALHRLHEQTSRFVDREEAIVGAIARRIEASPTGFVETYPGEVYPADNSAALAALAVHARATSRPAPAALDRGLRALAQKGIDPATGLLFHALSVTDASPRDEARASGTALAAYFLSFADAATSRSLFDALERGQFRTVLGFGGMMEYARGHRDAHASVDAGPLFLGFGVAASGYAIGASRAHGDRDTFTALYATAHLFGAPLDENGTRTYAMGGLLGDAILFAMLTTPRAGRLLE
ncbi:MAG TPA: hypothetical protein VM580_12505 [Labilithrix sp.]|nr:hypothetical protein [Labilithrix sp.]